MRADEKNDDAIPISQAELAQMASLLGPNSWAALALLDLQARGLVETLQRPTRRVAKS